MKKQTELADLFVVAFLALNGHKYQVHRSGDFVTFLFEETEDLQRDLLAYHKQDHLIGARTFANAIRRIKSMVTAAKFGISEGF